MELDVAFKLASLQGSLVPVTHLNSAATNLWMEVATVMRVAMSLVTAAKTFKPQNVLLRSLVAQ